MFWRLVNVDRLCVATSSTSNCILSSKHTLNREAPLLLQYHGQLRSESYTLERHSFLWKNTGGDQYELCRGYTSSSQSPVWQLCCQSVVMLDTGWWAASWSASGWTDSAAQTMSLTSRRRDDWRNNPTSNCGSAHFTGISSTFEADARRSMSLTTSPQWVCVCVCVLCRGGGLGVKTSASSCGCGWPTANGRATHEA